MVLVNVCPPFFSVRNFMFCLNKVHLNLYLQVKRVRAVINEGVREIWLSSEDTGAYGTLHYFPLRLLFNFIVYEKLIVS